MAFNDPTRLTVDSKVQDRLRQWFSKRADNSVVQLTCVQLGDSDINYELSQQASNIKVLNAPYQVEGIKHKLIFSGSQTNLAGIVKSFIRYVDSTGIVNSYYTYPTNFTLAQGVAPPTLANGVDTNNIVFTNNKEGYMIFPQTLPDGYVDSSGIPLRLIETYNFNMINMPTSWEAIIDQPNGSIFIAKPAVYSFLGRVGTISIQGQLSSLTKTITYNY